MASSNNIRASDAVHHLPPPSRYHAFSGRPNHDDSVHVDARNGQCECYFCQLRYFVLLYPLAVWRTVPNFVGPLATRRECHTSLKRRVWRSERTQIINSTKKCKIALIISKILIQQFPNQSIFSFFAWDKPTTPSHRNSIDFITISGKYHEIILIGFLCKVVLVTGNITLRGKYRLNWKTVVTW